MNPVKDRMWNSVLNSVGWSVWWPVLVPVWNSVWSVRVPVCRSVKSFLEEKL